jgi:hypothetical protein
MKKLFTLFVIIALTNSVFAQSPQKMSYQCVVRNSSGTLVTNQTVGMKISILQGSASGTVVFSETYSPNPQTNANGLVSIEIGSGIPVIGTFTGINWAAGPYFLKTETDPLGGTNYTIVGTSQLLSVPYALYAKTAGNGFSGNYNDLTNKPTLFSGSYPDLTNKPALFDGTWASLAGKPAFSAVATSGAWADITGKPTTLAGYGITNGMSTSHVANGITSTNIVNWTNAFSWGNHASVGYAVFPSQTGNSGRYLTTNGTTPAWSRLAVIGETGAVDEVLFEVKNKNGQTIFAVYNEGVRVYVDDGVVKGAKGGFAVGGFGDSKAPSQQYFFIDPDSIRAYVDTSQVKGAKGGFAVGGFGNSKGFTPLFLSMTPKNYFIGEGSGGKNTTGRYNSFMGFKTGFNNTIGGYNAFLGYQAGYTNISGNYNVFLGFKAGYKSTASYNTFLGYQAGIANTTGQYNAFMGYNSGFSNTSGSSNVFIGNQAGYSNTTGYSNVILGTSAGINNIDGFGNTFIGNLAGSTNTSGFWNIFIGESAGISNTTASRNIFIGPYAGRYNTTGDFNVFVGQQTGEANTTGRFNLFAGRAAGNFNTTGQLNTFLGINSGNANLTGNENVNLGGESGKWNSTGSYNVNLGTGAGFSNTNGNYNIMIGEYTGVSLTSGSSNIFIGPGAGGGLTNTSNKLFIENSTADNNNALIYGDFASDYLKINGNVDIRNVLHLTSTGQVLYVNNAEALYYNGTLFSWGFGATYNYFAKPITIGTSGNPGSYMLVVNGNAYSYGSWASSDVRWKKNIIPIGNPINKIIRLDGVNYEWRTDEFPLNNFDHGKQIGLIAQDVEKIFPELVRTDNNGYKAVSYDKLSVLLLEGMKEQQKQIESYRSENENLKSKLQTLQEKVEQIEALLVKGE